jgi:hypothetical protein
MTESNGVGVKAVAVRLAKETRRRCLMEKVQMPFVACIKGESLICRA